MAWTLEFSVAARKSLQSLDRTAARRIITYLEERVAPLEDPRRLGKILHGKKYEEQWRYRVGDYRIIAEIRDTIVTIVVIEVGHRREIYR